MSDRSDTHNPEVFTFFTSRPKITSCGLKLSDYPEGKIDTLDEDARGDKVMTKRVTCPECRTRMKRGWFLRWLLD